MVALPITRRVRSICAAVAEDDDIPEFVISFDQTGGTSRCTWFVVSQDEVRVLAVRQPLEIGFLP
jgi:hypothetical protein